jgi:Spy/CpxP family protein refolding chaperone
MLKTMQKTMRKITAGIGVLALALVVTSSATAPASAEAFGSGIGDTQEFAAQTTRPRVTIYPRQIYPGRNAKRQCRSTLVQEYRVSGPVIVPHMRCWWE